MIWNDPEEKSSYSKLYIIWLSGKQALYIYSYSQSTEHHHSCCFYNPSFYTNLLQRPFYAHVPTTGGVCSSGLTAWLVTGNGLSLTQGSVFPKGFLLFLQKSLKTKDFFFILCNGNNYKYVHVTFGIYSSLIVKIREKKERANLHYKYMQLV